MNELLNLILNVISVLFLFDIFLFLLSAKLKRQDIADVFWGIKFIIIALSFWLLAPGKTVPGTLVLFLVTLWGLRLFFHIGSRWLKKNEDKRYLDLSKNWGKFFYLRSFLQTFLFQSFLALAISIPVISLIFSSGQINNYLLFSGLSIWLFSLIIESVSDFQLSRFLKNPKNKGKVMDRGLWKYSRHPNYFGEVLLWWGIYIISLNDIERWWFLIIGPLTISFLILFVSGIPMVEKHYKNNKKYQKYSQKTSKFIPTQPKNN